jgi:hypothetical protein
VLGAGVSDRAMGGEEQSDVFGLVGEREGLSAVEVEGAEGVCLDEQLQRDSMLRAPSLAARNENCGQRCSVVRSSRRRVCWCQFASAVALADLGHDLVDVEGQVARGGLGFDAAACDDVGGRAILGAGNQPDRGLDNLADRAAG